MTKIEKELIELKIQRYNEDLDLFCYYCKKYAVETNSLQRRLSQLVIGGHREVARLEEIKQFLETKQLSLQSFMIEIVNQALNIQQKN